MKDMTPTIAKAFPPSIIDPKTFTSYGPWNSYPSATAFIEEIDGNSWNTIGHKFVDRHFLALSHTDPAGFVALLPAYVSALLSCKSQSQMVPLVLSQLTRTEEWPEKFDERAASLTNAQKAVVVQALEELHKDDCYPVYRAKIEQALDSWRTAM